MWLFSSRVRIGLIGEDSANHFPPTLFFFFLSRDQLHQHHSFSSRVIAKWLSELRRLWTSIPYEPRVSPFPRSFPHYVWTALLAHSDFVGSRMYACLAATFHLHFRQNDRGLLHATAVTQGWNGYQSKSHHRKLTLEKKILPPPL